MKSKNKRVIIVLSTIIVILGVFMFMLFYRGDYKEYSSSQSFSNLIDVLLKTSQGGNVELDEENINSLGTSYFKDGVKKGNITITGFKAVMNDDNIKILMPVKYRSLPLCLSTRGEVKVEGDYLIFSPEYFKVGMFTIQKAKALGYIGRAFNNKIKVQDNNILINKKLISGKIEIAAVKERKLITKVNDNTKKIIGKANKAIVNIENKINNSNNNNSTQSVAKGTEGKSNDKKSSSNSSELSSKEGNMISIMNSTIATLDSNPSYNYWPNVQKVMAIYETLSPEEKAKFKNKVYSNVDIARAKRVKSKIK